MRPLYILDRFPVPSETFIMEEIRGLRILGVDVRVFALACGSFEPTEDIPMRYSNGPVSDIGSVGVPRPAELLRLIRCLIRLFSSDPRWFAFGILRAPTVILAARLARSMGCSSVHGHFLGAPTVLAACAAAVARLPLSLSPHANLGAFSRRGTRVCLERSTFTAACWKGAASMLSERGPRVHTIPHGVRPERFAVERTGSEILRILLIGRLVPKKGIDVMIEAAILLEREIGAWRLEIIGDGPELGHLMRRAERLSGTDRVRFRGAVSHAAIPRALADSDVLVVPSVPVSGQTEGIPNVILEAFAASVLVVASNVGGIQEVVSNGETGILVPPGNPETLFRVLLRLVRREINWIPMVDAARLLVAREYNKDVWLTELARLHRGVGTRTPFGGSPDEGAGILQNRETVR